MIGLPCPHCFRDAGGRLCSSRTSNVGALVTFSLHVVVYVMIAAPPVPSLSWGWFQQRCYCQIAVRSALLFQISLRVSLSPRRAAPRVDSPMSPPAGPFIATTAWPYPTLPAGNKIKSTCCCCCFRCRRHWAQIFTPLSTSALVVSWLLTLGCDPRDRVSNQVCMFVCVCVYLTPRDILWGLL